jgi:hypothetical protein
MTDSRNERSSCCFRAEKSNGGKAIIKIQLFRCSMPLLKNAELSFNLLSSLSLEQAEAIADDMNEKVLDLSVTLSSDHPMFPRDIGN